MNNETSIILIFSRRLRVARDSLGVPLELPDINKFLSDLKIFIKTNIKNSIKGCMTGKLFNRVKIGGADEICRA
ncbi:hypothetical protein [uncultured Campylobacter sp.]|uniref:hypothetical protein n=1 Tax=uncultured Campylobacter sp. TaxID=218934 RepID=UPI0028E2B31A|nr:hypothetical protein [uncultured Campylobacter sp.]